MKEFLTYLAQQIVNNPEKVEVFEVVDNEGSVFLKIKVAPEDMGRIIGKSGKIINSIRAIVRVLAIKEGRRVQVDLEETPKVAEQPQVQEA